jgi:putative Mg2+ transporter-C (MgtC) family protein
MDERAQLEVLARVGLAAVLGALIGLEREFRGHEAGIRTTSLVCIGAAIFGEVGNLMGDSRVAQGVAQGIGFLGAGLMFTRGQSVHNVTTAATMWIVAAVGLAIAERLWLVGTGVAVAVVVLLELAPVSDWVYRRGKAFRGRRAAGTAGGERQPSPPA